ncbi:MAG: HAD-IA family hydrolase [Gammaproteobacteria bacterium]|nr:HAD-IA family hydrolase [Gammaproteobacteria bacterium]
MAYELLIFDWDGTLMDSADRIIACFRTAMTACGLSPLPPETIRSTIGLGVHEALARLLPDSSPERRLEVAHCYHEHFLFKDTTPSPLFADVERELARLREGGYQLAVATGKSRRGLDRALEISGLASLFVVSRCASETRSKPDPLMLKEILAETGVAANAALMVGDTTYDLEMAARARIDSVGVTYGCHARTDLLAHKPRVCIDTFAELGVWLREGDTWDRRDRNVARGG